MAIDMKRLGICIKKSILLLGLMTVMAYTTVILALWILRTGIQGYDSFPVIEPNPIIKHTEWILGIFGIFVCAFQIKDVIDS